MSGDPISEDTVPINTLRSFEPNTKSFPGLSGKVYYIEDTLSIERYKVFQRFEIEAGFGYSFPDLFQKINLAFDKMNEKKFADVCVILYNIMEGAVPILEKKPVGLYMATLFVNSADEDRGSWGKVMAEEKLKDWADIDSNFFLLVALSKVRNLAKTMRDISQLLESVGEVNLKEMQDQLLMDEDPKQ